MRLYLTFMLGLLLGISSCGPMNDPPTANPNDVSRLLSENSPAQISQKNQFLIFVSGPSKKQLRDNPYFIRLVYADLRSLSSEAKLTIHYWMPDMLGMGKSQAVASRKADGSFTSTLSFSMEGIWEISIHIQDGSIEDEYIFQESI